MNNNNLPHGVDFLRQLHMVGKRFPKEEAWGIFTVFNNARAERLKLSFDSILFGAWCGWTENAYELLKNCKSYLDGRVYKGQTLTSSFALIRSFSCKPHSSSRTQQKPLFL